MAETTKPHPAAYEIEAARSALRLWCQSLGDHYDASMAQVSLRAIHELLSEARAKEKLPELRLLFAYGLVVTAESALWEAAGADDTPPGADDLRATMDHVLHLLDVVLGEAPAEVDESEVSHG